MFVVKKKKKTTKKTSVLNKTSGQKFFFLSVGQLVYNFVPQFEFVATNRYCHKSDKHEPMHCNMICGRLGWYLDPINIFSCSRRSQKASRIQLVRCQQHLTQNSGTYRNTTNQNCLKRNSFISPHLHPCTYVDSVSLMLHYPSISELFFPLPLSWRSSQCVKCDVRPSCCSSIMIFLVELSITQQALMRHESAIRSTDNCIFLFRNKVARPVGINLNGDFDWCNERVVSHWDWRCSMVPCLPLTQSEEEVVFWRGWKASEVGQLLWRLVQSKVKVTYPFF